ncbi:MAG TPA: hypothetical protein VHF69_13660 [Candidatus Synoicihabitans sp.]|nr:hypothetical protein [Candidatus Synoicihabitans sp.]
MLFAALPDARHVALVDYVRHCFGAVRRATPGQAPVPVARPSVSRYIIAVICGWLLWQPLASRGAAEVTPPAASILVETTAENDRTIFVSAGQSLPPLRR